MRGKAGLTTRIRRIPGAISESATKIRHGLMDAAEFGGGLRPIVKKPARRFEENQKWVFLQAR